MTAPVLATELRGRALINEPELNKGTAFNDEERVALGLDGLLPSRVETLAEQRLAVRAKYDRLGGDLERHIFLRSLEDTNEVLYYAFLDEHLAELMPVVYTPTVGEACQQFSRIYRRPHGLFLSYPDRHRMRSQLQGLHGDIDVVVATDGQRILGLGDQGMGGMGIPIGKLSLYTAIGGIDPRRSLPVLLDVGTDNRELLDDPMYLGWRHERITGDDYFDFVDQFVTELRNRFPNVLLQWEDFGVDHAATLLERYRDRILSFNDDIQGTAAVAVATIRAALATTERRLADQRVCIVGAGSAGCGIASLLVRALELAGVTDPHAHLFLTDVDGLLHDRRTDLSAEQRRFTVPWQAVAGWADANGPTDLHAVAANMNPTVLVGVSGQPGLFTESIVSSMLAATDQPVILPLSNPTSRSEATPVDLLNWTNGDAVVAAGSPFDDVVRCGVRHRIPQANNVYVFPGLGVGALEAGAPCVTDAMILAASSALADAAASDGAGLLPPLERVRETSCRIARAVALAALTESGTPDSIEETLGAIDRRIARRWWSPVYPELRPVSPQPHEKP